MSNLIEVLRKSLENETPTRGEMELEREIMKAVLEGTPTSNKFGRYMPNVTLLYFNLDTSMPSAGLDRRRLGMLMDRLNIAHVFSDIDNGVSIYLSTKEINENLADELGPEFNDLKSVKDFESVIDLLQNQRYSRT